MPQSINHNKSCAGTGSGGIGKVAFKGAYYGKCPTCGKKFKLRAGTVPRHAK